MAEAILKSRWNILGRGALAVRSMGISGIEGQPASEPARQLCQEHGLNIESHRSQALQPDGLLAADIIFVMDPGQLSHLRLLMPALRDKIFMLGAWPGKPTRNSTIRDPIGRPMRVYRSVYNAIDQHIERIMPSLLELAGK